MIKSSGVKSLLTSSLDTEDGGVGKEGALDEATPRGEAENGPGAIGVVACEAGTDGAAMDKVATSGAAGGGAVALHPRIHKH